MTVNVAPIFVILVVCILRMIHAGCRRFGRWRTSSGRNFSNLSSSHNNKNQVICTLNHRMRGKNPKTAPKTPLPLPINNPTVYRDIHSAHNNHHANPNNVSIRDNRSGVHSRAEMDNSPYLALSTHCDGVCYCDRVAGFPVVSCVEEDCTSWGL